MTRDEVAAACREILRGHVRERLLDDVAASCPSVEHARRAVAEMERVRRERSRP